jgi:hypothetical protein
LAGVDPMKETVAFGGDEREQQWSFSVVPWPFALVKSLLLK